MPDTYVGDNGVKPIVRWYLGLAGQQRRVITARVGNNGIRWLGFLDPLLPPATISAGSPTETTVQVTMTASPSVAVDGYRVYYRAGQDFTDVADADGYQDFLGLIGTVIGLSINTTYYFRAKAFRYPDDIDEHYSDDLSDAATQATNSGFSFSVLMPMFTAGFSLTSEAPGRSLTFDATMPMFDVSVTFQATFVTPNRNLTFAATMPMLTGSFSMTYVPPGTILTFDSVTMPMFTGSFDVTNVTPTPDYFPTITFGYQNLDVCPTIQVCATLDHTGPDGDNTKTIGMQWKNGLGGTWSTESTFSPGSTTVCMSGMPESSAIYIRCRYIGETVYDEYGPISTTNCGGPPE